MTDRKKKPSPQPWKFEVPRYIDFEQEFACERDDEPTMEIFIDDPDLIFEGCEE